MIGLLRQLLRPSHPAERAYRALESRHPRSSRWPAVEKAHLAESPLCIVCGRKPKSPQVHHKKPYHLHPELELDPDNLATVCGPEDPVWCHLLFGHLLKWASYNPCFATDAALWLAKIKNRPAA